MISVPTGKPFSAFKRLLTSEPSVKSHKKLHSRRYVSPKVISENVIFDEFEETI